jgi:hypothetical protein
MRPSSAHPILKAFAASAALLTSNAWTTPFRYNEAVSGDLPDPRINGEPTVLTVTFRHNEPIWDNDASRCDPDIGDDPRCLYERTNPA